jgi:hypothetical protein
MALEIQVLAWDRHNNVAGLKRLMGSQPSPSNNWISIYMYVLPLEIQLLLVYIHVCVAIGDPVITCLYT